MGIATGAAGTLCVLSEVTVSLVVLTFVEKGGQGEGQVKAAQGVLERVIPQHVDLFYLTLVPSTGNDFFEVESVGDRVQVRGTSGVALTSGVYWYLQNYCNSSISWLGDNINIPDPAPRVKSKVRVDTPYKYRYYFNVCTFGYSTVWWDWSRWERELDWMALHGVNAPLAFNGQEYVWYSVWQDMGLSKSDIDPFFSGPAFLPWQRMGNLDGWRGPLSTEWLEGQHQLQKLIVARARSLGMTTVLPAFAGHVPAGLKVRYPNATISRLGSWNHVFNGTFFLDAEDPLFKRIGTAFIKKQVEAYGTDHLYNADPFNELEPPTNEPAFLAQVSKTIYSALTDADDQAVWVLQGWFLLEMSSFWQPPQTKAFLGAVPDSGMLVLDLWAEVKPGYAITDSFYGKPFVWNMLHNFGGRSGLYGALPNVTQGPITALNTPNAHMVGMGMTMEAINTNPIAYDLLTDMFWHNTTVKLDDWVTSYAIRRYGSRSPVAIAAWRLLQNSVYSCDTKQQGTSGSIVAARPSFSIWSVSVAPIALYYDPQDVVKAWRLLLAAEDLGGKETYGQDLVMVGQQVLSNLALDLHKQLVTAYNQKNLTLFRDASERFLVLIGDMEVLTATQPNFLLGEWIQSARRWGSTYADKASPPREALFELNARTQVTLWGPPVAQNGLHEYAYKLWAGLIGDFYQARWSLFFSKVTEALQTNESFNYGVFEAQVIALEYDWTVSSAPYPTRPSGLDTQQVARSLYSKYFM